MQKMMPRLTPTETTSCLALLHVEDEFYVRPIGSVDYAEEATTGRFELVWMNPEKGVWPCGRSFKKNKEGVLVTYVSNGYICSPREEPVLNLIADRACFKLRAQGW